MQFLLHDSMLGFHSQKSGAYHLAKKPGNLGLKSNGTEGDFPEIPFGICGLPPHSTLYFRFGTERRKIPYHLHEYPFPGPFTMK